MASDVRRFGDFEVNLALGELRRGSERVRLQEQPFQILAMLLERPAEIVTRDQIRERLWADGTTVDFEHSVNTAIRRLRHALGDPADNPKYVETLHRRGYRFLAAVEEGPVSSLSARRLQPRKPRLIVLPFANLSEARGQEYF